MEGGRRHFQQRSSGCGRLTIAAICFGIGGWTYDVAVVFGDDDEFPTIDADTASFACARLQGMREEVATGYDEAALDRFASKARKWRKDGRDAYLFMINGAKVRAPAAALALQERLCS